MKMNEDTRKEDFMKLIHNYVTNLKDNVVKAIIDTRESNPNIPISPSEAMNMAIHILKELQSKAEELEDSYDKEASEEIH